jgi:hypothetical protein
VVGYSGFSAANYFEQPYSPDLDFGTGDFCFMGWATFAAVPGSSQAFFDRSAGGAGGAIGLHVNATINFVCAANWVATNTAVPTPTGTALYAMVRENGTLKIYVNGVLVYSVANTTNVTNAPAVTRLGTLYNGTSPCNSGSLALWRSTATAPSADQIAHIYRSELALFQPGAKCTLDGTSGAVTALEYDDVTDTLHAGTSWGRSAFRDLLRIESEISTVGAITSLAAHQGAIITGGTTSGRYYQPAMLLRDELRRKDEARQALGKIPVYMQDVGVTSKTAFTLQLGYQVVAVYAAGLLKDVGVTLDYTLSFDGFRWTVTFAVAPANGARLNFVLVRS